MKNNKDLQGHLAAFFTILVWGTTYISTKVLLQFFQPVEILFFRFIMGFVALILVYPHPLKVVHKKQEVLFAGAGLCGITLYFLLENIALTYAMASFVGIIISVAPFLTAILAHIFLEGEKLKFNFFLGFFIAMVGICLINFNGTANLHMNPLGNVLAFLAAVVWAVYSILSRKISSYGYHVIQVTRRTFFYGILFMIPALFLFDFQLDFVRFTKPVNLFNILFLGLGASAFCFVTWNIAVKKLGAVKTSIYIYMSPVVTIVTSILVLNEKITMIAAVGTLLTLAGLFISESKLSWRKKEIEELDSYNV